MSTSAGFLDFVTEQMMGFGPVSVRRMFGGAGVFRDGVMFALIVDEALYFKADQTTEGDFKAEGMSPFTYQTKKSPRTVMSYWHAPAGCLDDPDQMTDWCRRAFAVALRSAKSPARKSKAR